MNKYIFRIIMAVFAFIAVLPMTALADNDKADAVVFKQVPEGVSVRLILPKAAGEKTASLQLSVEVKSAGSGEIDDVAFKFAEIVDKRAKVAEFRYHKDTGLLNLYVAGTEALYKDNEDTLTLGTITAKDQNAADVSVKAGVPKNALTLAEGTESRIVDLADNSDTQQGGSDPGTSGDGNTPGTPGDGTNPGGADGNTPGTPGDGTNPGGADGNIPGTPGDGTNPGGADGNTPGIPGDGTNPGGADGNTPGNGDGSSSGTGQTIDKKLKDTLKKADSYPKDKYTSKSYKALEKAKKKAQQVLNDPNATEEEKEAALRDLENAIGALEPAGTQNTADKEKNTQARQAKTGDTSQPVLYALIALLSVLTASLALYLRRYYHI
ncbi:MAG: hypothetical protein HFH01_00590 [Dorea sp.]|nr:hypothetical protein [Dorea sp.]